jgi:2-iminobutanoate/2-iminopropanoate deaminase
MRHEPATRRRSINLPGRSSNLPFSDAVLVDDTLYLAGRIGIDPVTGRAPADVNAELKLLFDGVEAVLAEAGMTMDDLVHVQIYSPDVSLWESFNTAYVQRFSKGLPSRAFLGSGPLLLGGRFEMVGIAVRETAENRRIEHEEEQKRAGLLPHDD